MAWRWLGPVTTLTLVYSTLIFFFNIKFVAAGVIIDQPYGLEQEAWDRAWSAAEMKAMFRQIDAAAKSTNFWVALYCNHLILSDTVRHLTEFGYQNVSVFTWWKHNFNIESAMHVLFATEYVVMAWRRGISGMPCQLDPNPTKRHNVFVGSQQRSFHRDATGNLINPYQKPAYLAYNMCKAFCEPHDTIVIVGSGAGGDIEGAVAAMMNVVAFETDPKQFQLTEGVWRKFQEKLESLDRTIVFPGAFEGKLGSYPLELDVPARFVASVQDHLRALLQAEAEEASRPPTSCSSCDNLIADPESPDSKCASCGLFLCNRCETQARSLHERDPMPVGRYCSKDCLDAL